MKYSKDDIKKDFLEELIREGDLWRIFRKTTFLDLIRVEFESYKLDFKKVHLAKIFNNSIKYLMFDKLPAINVQGDLTGTLNQLNNNYPYLVEQYEIILSRLFREYQDKPYDQYNLSNNISYLKIYNNLLLDNISDQFIEEVAWASFTMLTYLND